MKVFAVALFLVLLGSVCRSQVSNEMIKSSPDQKVAIVLYFKKDTKNEDINYFLENVIGKNREDGRGHNLLEGMQGTFTVRTQDYEGCAIELRRNVTKNAKIF